jgi:hypothetical protein
MPRKSTEHVASSSHRLRQQSTSFDGFHKLAFNRFWRFDFMRIGELVG